jgi:lactate dehydrogenase-like 2-hydroxyacid dehydrogenase
MALARPTVLLFGSLPQRAEEQIAVSYATVKLPRADHALITPRLAERVTGMAGVGPVDAQIMDALPNLEIIASFGVGYDGTDAAHARSKGIVVTNTPDVLNEEVADATIGLLINTLRELPKAEAWLRAGRWEQDGPYRLTRGTLRGRTAGIYGMGRIGRAIARRLEGFGLPVCYHNRRQLDDGRYRYFSSLLELAGAVDILISAVPGGPATDRAIDASVLAALGRGGILINVGRGSTVDEAALIEALENGVIGGAGLDVYTGEPHVPAGLLALDNVSLLPHVASGSIEARGAVADLVAANIRSWFEEGRALTPVPETAHVVRRLAAFARS